MAVDDDEEDTNVRIVPAAAPPPEPEPESPRHDRRAFLVASAMAAGGTALALMPGGSRPLPPPPPAPASKAGDLAGGKPTTVRTACPVCPVGCTFDATLDGGRWTAMTGVVDSPINRGRLCDRATAARADAIDGARLTQPMKRDGAGWKTLDWPTALREIAGHLKSVRTAGGPDSVYWMGSGRFTNEQAYLFRKLAALWGTNNLDYAGRNDREGIEAGLSNLWGMGGATNSLSDLRNSKVVLVVGADPAARAPIAMDHIAAARREGAALVVADALRTRTAEAADRFIRLRPGSEIALAWGLLWHLQRLNKVDLQYFLRRVHGNSAIRTEVARWTPAEVKRVADLEPAAVEALARLLADRRPAALIWSGGGTRDANAANSARAFAILQLALGNIGVSGGGFVPLAESPNGQGASDMGLLCNSLPGYYGLEEKAWKHWARAWDLDYAFVRRRFASADALTRPGVTGARWADAVLAGEEALSQPAPVRGVMLFGHDAANQTDLTAVARALRTARLVVIANDRPTLAAALPESHDALYLLPAAGPFEDSGSVTLLDRTQQWRAPVLPPRGGARRYDEILVALADAVGLGRPLTKNIRRTGAMPNLEDVAAEMRQGLLSLGYSGATPARIRAQMLRPADFSGPQGRAEKGPLRGEVYGLPYPCWGTPDQVFAGGRAGHPGTPILFDVTRPIAEGGHCFWGRFGAERDGRTILAEIKGPATSHFQYGYVEFFMIHLINLGWSKELTAAERRAIREVEGNSTSWRFDPSGGILRVALAHGCAPSGNGKARAIVWNFPDPVPLHREPVLTRRRDLVDASLAGGRRLYPAPADTRRYRLMQRAASIQRRDLAAEFPFWLVFVPPAPARAENDLSRLFHVMVNPADARRLKVEAGGAVRLFGPVDSAPVPARAVITDRVPPGVAAAPLGYAGLWHGADMRGRYPPDLSPSRFGEPAYLLAGPEYSLISGGQEGRLSLCRIEAIRQP